ncbi:MAG: hypothetical protein RDU76_11465 [Candidatus Edwardsbacteria bacterium]|nr:hypothetical protein [Candidatus Edwardsbacteria bacterium]
MHAGAEFLGWQEIPGRDPIALYNVTDPASPRYHSTVSAATLQKLGIAVPHTPPIENNGGSK